MLTRFAPAKVNLALHVTGRREDGYHLIDTLVAFAGIGDEITVAPAASTDPLPALAITGRFAEDLAATTQDAADNLVIRAARALAEAAGRPQADASITLVKDLPIASGIGGGSADAAATLLALNDLWRTGLDGDALAAIGLRLGADVPMCLAGHAASGRTLLARGVGEIISPGPLLPEGLGIVLANPGVAVPTPAVFRALTQRNSPPLPPCPDAWDDLTALVDWLEATRNDLSAPAIGIAPIIAETLDALRRTPHCRLARMSGSGATCFGLYADEEQAARAAARLEGRGLWVAAGPLG